MKNAENYISLARSLATLFKPLVEVVLHNISSKKIMFIAGEFPGRLAGDPSLLDEHLEEKIHEYKDVVYTKVTRDGRLVKSISVPLWEDGQLVALLCINVDTTVFQDLHALTGLFIPQTTLRQPDALFKKDWQERINQFIYEALRAEGSQIASLTSHQKKNIVIDLYRHGAFSEKKAADYIAQALGLSRATVFNYLRIYKGAKL